MSTAAGFGSLGRINTEARLFAFLVPVAGKFSGRRSLFFTRLSISLNVLNNSPELEPMYFWTSYLVFSLLCGS